jgi:hypothetical protein
VVCKKGAKILQQGKHFHAIKHLIYATNPQSFNKEFGKMDHDIRKTKNKVNAIKKRTFAT